jgi:3-dehydroquinate synthase class II
MAYTDKTTVSRRFSLINDNGNILFDGLEISSNSVLCPRQDGVRVKEVKTDKLYGLASDSGLKLVYQDAEGILFEPRTAI